jgi:acyl-CoA hydrolase
VPRAFFDLVLDLPGRRRAVRVAAAAGQRRGVRDRLYASALVRDGGTLQIGIGSLSDALCHG